MLGLCAFALCSPIRPANATRIAISEFPCPTTESPSGITFLDASGFMAFVDAQFNRLQVVDTRDCSISATIDLTGKTRSPSAVAWDTARQRYAIADVLDSRIVYLGPGGAPLGGCSLRAAGIERPFGLDYDEDNDRYVALVERGSEIAFVAPTPGRATACQVIERRELPPTGLFTPSGIAWMGAPDYIAVADFDGRQVALLSGGLEVTDFFRTGDVSSNKPTGVDYDPQTERFALSDAGNETIRQVDARGTVQLKCTIEGGAPAYEGLTAVRSTGELALVSGRDGNSLTFVDGETCEVQRIVDLSTLQFSAPADVAWIESTNELAIADIDTKRLTFVSLAAETTRECALQTLNPFITRPAELAYLPDLDWIIVADNDAFFATVIDTNCRFQFQLDLSQYLRTDYAIAYQPGAGRLIASGFSDRDLQVGDTVGRTVLQFSSAVPRLTGLVFLPGGAELFALNRDSPTLYELQVPALVEAPGASGTFTGGGARLVLLERNAGVVAGKAFLGTTALEAYGFVDNDTGGIDLVLELPTGRRRSLSGEYSADRMTLTLPAPLGVLEREY